jgi:putative ABC transport system ATP-binding protein
VVTLFFLARGALPVADAVLVVRGLVKVFGLAAAKVEVLSGVDLTVRAGEFVAVMGSSGSGKSTLLHLVAGLDHPNSGSIHLAGVDLARLDEDQRAVMRRHRLGLIFQSFHLLETLSALENVLLPLSISGRPGPEARQRGERALQAVGLLHRRQHLPDQLSGGEKQRVAIARAIVIEPVILLADEPTGNLDRVQGDKIMDLLRRLVDERKQALLMVTHDIRHARRADRILRLHDGRLLLETIPADEPALLDAGVGSWIHERGTAGVQSALAVPTFPAAPAATSILFVQPGAGDPFEGTLPRGTG